MQIASPIIRYGLRLRPVTATDLETVRRWRNADHVRSKMAFQDVISPAMQAAWWAGLDPLCNHYYLISHRSQDIGVIHAKDIDWAMGSAETGIFVGETAYLETFVPVLAVLALMDALFEDAGLLTLQAKIMSGEPRILAFNLRLGYQVKADWGDFLMLHVDRATYFQVAAPLRVAAAKWAITL